TSVCGATGRTRQPMANPTVRPTLRATLASHEALRSKRGVQMSSAVITCALTGPIATKGDNPNLPTTPEEIAEAARGAHEAGAAVVHVPVRDADGRPTADLEVARRTVGLIEEACPALVQLSTGVGLDVPFEEREKLVEARPRMASLNPCSMSFADGEFR